MKQIYTNMIPQQIELTFYIVLIVIGIIYLLKKYTMTRKRKHELFVTFHYHTARRNKRKYTNIFTNFLNNLKCTFSRQSAKN